MPESIIDYERDEARSEHERFIAEADAHPLGCTCSRACRLEAAGMSERESRWGQW